MAAMRDVGALLKDIGEIVPAEKTWVDQCDADDHEQSGKREGGLLPVE